MWTEKLTGYPRENGRKGIRNLVVVLSAADNVNPLIRHLATQVPSVVALPASYGRNQMGKDFEVTLRAMAGLAAHPNVAACLIVSFEPESGQRIASIVSESGRKAATMSFLQEGGMDRSVVKGSKMLHEMLESAKKIERVPLHPEELVVGLECGGSDTTSGLFGNPALGTFTDWLIDHGGTAVFSEPVECLGAEELLRKRAASPALAESLIATAHLYVKLAWDQGVDLMGVNPTPDNIAGGLSSVEEKSLGALAKTGSRTIMGVLGYGERPPAAGIWMMDAPAAAVENITALAAGGAQLISFVTGSGNPTGHPIAPTIKMSANPTTVRRMAAHIDISLANMVQGKMNLQQAAEIIGIETAAVINGKLTACEKLDFVETNISRIGRSV